MFSLLYYSYYISSIKTTSPAGFVNITATPFSHTFRPPGCHCLQVLHHITCKSKRGSAMVWSQWRHRNIVLPNTSLEKKQKNSLHKQTTLNVNSMLSASGVQPLVLVHYYITYTKVTASRPQILLVCQQSRSPYSHALRPPGCRCLQVMLAVRL